jgi:uncharacterized protein YaaN involved in tellurite resistance
MTAPATAVAQLEIEAPEPPKPVLAVQNAQVDQPQIEDEATRAKLDALVNNFAAEFDTLKVQTPEFKRASAGIAGLGAKQLKSSAEASGRLLEQPMRQMSKTAPGNQVATGLSDLRTTLEDLDPSKNSALHGLLAKLPGYNPMKRYFRQYQGADEQIEAIVNHLRNGQDTLLKDNVAIASERQRLWADMEMLKQYIYVANQIQLKLREKIESVRSADPELARELEGDLLFKAIQRQQDLATQLAVAMQGFLAYGLIEKTNEELIYGVERACTTTVAALKVAVGVAAALANQQLVMKSIDSVNAMTSKLIADTSIALREQTAGVYQQAAESGVKLEDLQTAFNNIFATIDSIDTYKQQAVDAMGKTVASLQVEINRAQEYVDRSSQEDRASGAADQLKI